MRLDPDQESTLAFIQVRCKGREAMRYRRVHIHPQEYGKSAINCPCYSAEATECNAGECITTGCIPNNTNGVDIFFQGGESPKSATWLANGRADGALTIPGSPNNIFWYGYPPPATPFPSGSGVSGTRASPAVTITGRSSNGKPDIETRTAPTQANDVDFTWYLPNYESGSDRGCTTVNGQWWSSPALSNAYSTNGVLSGPVTVPHCPTSSGGSYAVQRC
jgi:hypothetical protein